MLNDRICRFKEYEDQHKRQDAEQQRSLLPAGSLCFFQGKRERIGQKCRQKKQDAIPQMQIHIKHIAGKQKKSPSVFVRNEIIEKKYDY